MWKNYRPRRLRQSRSIRNLVRETHLSVHDLIYPVFLKSLNNDKEEISSLKGQFRWGLEALLFKLESLHSKGLKSVCLFPLIDENLKDSQASYAMRDDCYYYDVIRRIKKEFPDLLVMTDIALDPYSSDGHDGVVDPKTGKILNDQTLEILREMALRQAHSGADILGPSDMMDGRVHEIRDALEKEHFHDVIVMSYAAKYASAFYGPFRDALDSAPKSGDKKTYQMDPSNKKEALREAQLDMREGADILMVKPALSYLDVIHLLKSKSLLPISAYNVSGEYAMLQASAQMGYLDLDKAALESLISIKRAGADMILTYFTDYVIERGLIH